MRLPTIARPSCVFDGQAGFFVVHSLSVYYADHVVSPILLYATDMKMPVALMAREDMKELRQSCKLMESQGDENSRFETKQELGDEEYQK